MRKIALAISISIIALAVAGLASAAPKQPKPPVQAPGSVTVGWSETLYDSSGKVTSHREGKGDHAGDVGARPDLPPQATNADPTESPRRLASASGCADYAGYVRSWTVLGFLAYEFEHGAHVCWSYPHLTQFVPWAQLRYSDGQHQLTGVSAYGYYYQWPSTCCGDGGHYSHRQGTVTNCVFRYGCIGSELPWVDLYVVANGAWSVYGGK